MLAVFDKKNYQMGLEWELTDSDGKIELNHFDQKEDNTNNNVFSYRSCNSNIYLL